MSIKENILHVKKEIENARIKGAKQKKVDLIVVTKERQNNEITEILKYGENKLGENKVQELEEKAPSFPNAKWHFIGHLQSNKAKTAVELCELIHSVDSVKLLRRINEVAREIDKVQKVLLEVNVSGEETKFGFKPQELAGVLDTLKQLPFQNIEINGLMTMAPLIDAEKTRPYFKALYNLGQELYLHELSMGMSNDYIVAVQEGATMTRVGTAIFGK